MGSQRKHLGQFFTSDAVAGSLVRWVVRRTTDRLLDPSCGDGQFVVHHRRSVGVEFDPDHARTARLRAPAALIHGGDFFRWAAQTKERFEAVAGNPPFIRYQSFTGETRNGALGAAALMGARFSGLTSSWAPFVIVAASLLKRGGRMAFVVPAEIGHANYSRALVPSLCAHFSHVQVNAYREKFFPNLSEDCWTLFCDGYGGKTDVIHFAALHCFEPTLEPPGCTQRVALAEWRKNGGRLRPFLLSRRAYSLYQAVSELPGVLRFGDVASASIGYVTGDNDFFHLRPTQAKRIGVPPRLLRPSVRKSEQLGGSTVDAGMVDHWLASDEPILLLDLNRVDTLPTAVREYLDSEGGQRARTRYKCRNRRPWYAVPDVTVPAAFLTVMNGAEAQLVNNAAGCVCTNSLHAVRLIGEYSVPQLQKAWRSSLSQLGTEIEGHPLGGGMLKIEPLEAARIPIPVGGLDLDRAEEETLIEATLEIRGWRHHA